MEKDDYSKVFETIYTGIKKLKSDADTLIGPASTSEEVARIMGYKDSAKSMISSFDEVFASRILEMNKPNYKKGYFEGMLDFVKALHCLIQDNLIEDTDGVNIEKEGGEFSEDN